MKTDPRLLETLRRLAMKGAPDTMPTSLCPEGAAADRIEELDRTNEALHRELDDMTERCRMAEHRVREAQRTALQPLLDRMEGDLAQIISLVETEHVIRPADMPAAEVMLLQARKPDGGDWVDIWPAQLSWLAKEGNEVRALSQQDGAALTSGERG